MQDIHQALKHYFGFDTFKGNQEAIIRHLLDGGDTFVLMPTGGGKSLCYQLPALMMEGTAIVVSPLIALMKNQVDQIRAFCGDDDVAHFLNSSLSRPVVEQVKRSVLSGRTKMLYVAPESLTKEDNVAFFSRFPISFFAIDEAHCISEWGHDFRPEYRKIRPIIERIGPRPVIALTATATPKVQHDIQKNLGMTEAAVFKSSFNRPNLYYEIRPKTRDIEKDIIRFVKNRPGQSGIIYCLSRKRVEDLAELLQLNGVRALAYHAGMEPQVRSDNQDAFLMERVDVIVATIAFGMGIDKPDVRYVIHFDMPKSLEGYYQETGRAGRDGGEGHCLAFYSYRDLQKMEKFLQGKPLVEQEIGRQLLKETAYYAESSVCRRKTLLHYFGEPYKPDHCGACDNCLNPPTEVDATEALLVILELIDTLKEKFKAEHITDIARGFASASVKSFDHQNLELFGAVSDKDERFLGTVIKQAALQGLIVRDIENYGILRLTPLGRAFLKRPGKFHVVEDRTFSDEPGPASTGPACLDPGLLDVLKSLRADIAQRVTQETGRNTPPYIIFEDPSLEAMATMYPITMAELSSMPGVGEQKARKWGAEFLKVICRHVELNEIERPEDLRVYSRPDSSREKVSLIICIDKQMMMEDICTFLKKEPSEVLALLESIVRSGTRIHLDYMVRQLIDDDIYDQIVEYLQESPDGNVTQAVNDLAQEGCEEDEVRLVRLKYFCDNAF